MNWVSLLADGENMIFFVNEINKGSKLKNHEESQTGGRQVNWLFYKCSCEVIIGVPRTLSPSCRIRGTPNHRSGGLIIVGFAV